jgi:cell division cycle 2-like
MFKPRSLGVKPKSKPAPSEGRSEPLKKKSRPNPVEDHAVKDMHEDISTKGSLPPPLKQQHKRHIPCRSIENYEPLGYISKGTFGIVNKARCKDTSEIFAIKQMKIETSTMKEGIPMTILRECNILFSLNHPNIIKLKEVCKNDDDDSNTSSTTSISGKVYLVMEYAGEDLRTILKQRVNKKGYSIQKFALSAELKNIMAQILSATAYLHKHRILHRDLKTSNILYNQENRFIKLCDFGSSRKLECINKNHDIITKDMTTMWYRDVAILRSDGMSTGHWDIYEGNYFSIDTWSIGVIMGELIQGSVLFARDGEVKQLEAILEMLDNTYRGVVNKTDLKSSSMTKVIDETIGIRRHFEPLGLNSNGCHFLAAMLRLDPKNRLIPRKLLEHSWLNEIV